MLVQFEHFNAIIAIIMFAIESSEQLHKSK